MITHRLLDQSNDENQRERGSHAGDYTAVKERSRVRGL